MDRLLFTEQAPGRLVQIEKPQKDWAFVPNELPLEWAFDDRLWPLLVEARAALGTLNGIGQYLPHPELLLRPLQTREAIESSKIEGTYVTPEQLLLYELDPREPRSADEKLADWREVSNYSAALRHGLQLLDALPVCNRLIREMHQVLMQGVRGRKKTPGEFRKGHVQIGDSGRFIPPPGGEVERLTSNLERYMNVADSPLDPLVRAYIVHYQFEAIHPFLDGNGRVGRALLALTVSGWLGHSMPWLYMSAYFERYRDEYVERLFNVSARGECFEWIEFCLRGTICQANDSIKRCREFKRLRGEFQRRIESPSGRTHPLLDQLFGSPVLTIPAVVKAYGVSYPTARDDVQRLVDAKILAEIEDAHPRSFYSPELFAIAYGEPNWEAIAASAIPVVGASPEHLPPMEQLQPPPF